MNAKGDLIARLLALGQGTPTFDTEETGPAHARTFKVSVQVGGRELGSGAGRTKKDAEREAAEAALQALNTSPSESSAPQREGAWPIYAQVLAQAIDAALEFAGDAATLDDVQHDAAQFYRGLLSELGHGPQVDP